MTIAEITTVRHDPNSAFIEVETTPGLDLNIQGYFEVNLYNSKGDQNVDLLVCKLKLPGILQPQGRSQWVHPLSANITIHTSLYVHMKSHNPLSTPLSARPGYTHEPPSYAPSYIQTHWN